MTIHAQAMYPSCNQGLTADECAGQLAQIGEQIQSYAK